MQTTKNGQEPEHVTKGEWWAWIFSAAVTALLWFKYLRDSIQDLPARAPPSPPDPSTTKKHRNVGLAMKFLFSSCVVAYIIFVIHDHLRNNKASIKLILPGVLLLTAFCLWIYTCIEIHNNMKDEESHPSQINLLRAILVFLTLVFVWFVLKQVARALTS